MKTYVSYASEKVPMNAQDIQSLKTMELCRSAGLTLMGFKPRFAFLTTISFGPCMWFVLTTRASEAVPL